MREPQLPGPPPDGVLDTGQLQQLLHPGPPVRVPGHHQLDHSPQLGLEVDGEAGVRTSRPEVVPELSTLGKVHVSGQLQQRYAETEDVTSLGEDPGQDLWCEIHRIPLHTCVKCQTPDYLVIYSFTVILSLGEVYHQAEVSQFTNSIHADEDILWFYVHVDEIVIVKVLESKEEIHQV